MTRYAYLGPEGTFTQQALLSWVADAEHEQVPLGSVDAALDALRSGEVDAAVVDHRGAEGERPLDLGVARRAGGRAQVHVGAVLHALGVRDAEEEDDLPVRADE